MFITLKIVLCVVVAFATIAPTDSNEYQYPVSTIYRIIGGKSTLIELFPYQLQLTGVFLDDYGQERSVMCGAALIHPKVALTAAHCVLPPANLHVRAGSSTWGQGGIYVLVEKAVVHPRYDAGNYHEFDMAILFLLQELPLSTHIQTVSLPPKLADLPRGLRGNVTGWGIVDTATQQFADVLQVIEVPVVQWDECSRLTGFVQTTKFCAGYATRLGFDSCQGDSGGPFVSDGVLYGLVSAATSNGCGNLDQLGTYTNLALFRDFIYSQTGL